jgi:filamentous hemagglutinin
VTLSRTAAPLPHDVPAAGLGATLSIQGNSIEQNGAINLPSGSVALHATGGDVHLGAASTINASGAVVNLSGTEAAGAGGSVALTADAGNVVIDNGASVDVSGAASSAGTNGNAGSLQVAAPQGMFVFAGDGIHGGAAAGQKSGSFTLDVGSGLAASGLASLDALLAAGGFHGDLTLRTRNDVSVVLSDAIDANSFELAADRGSIDVAGSAVIDTSGNASRIDGGRIALWAGTGLTIESGATLNAHAGPAGPMGANGQALAARGGDITLGTVAGTLQLGGGTSTGATVFDLRGTNSDSDGTLTLRAPRSTDQTSVQLAVQNPAGVVVHSANAIVVEGVRRYTASSLGAVDSGCGSGGTCDIADLNGALAIDAGNFLTHAQAIAAASGLGNVSVRAGIEVDSSGDLTVGDGSSAVWDLASWNTALGAPMAVTLRAAGNLVVNTSISDGFTDNGRELGSWSFGEPGTTPDSGSLRLTAGADLGAANPMAVVNQPRSVSSYTNPGNSGNLIVEPGMLIRTGTGSIDMSAGGDVLLGYAFSGYDANNNLLVAESDPLSAAIYTAGAPSALSPAQTSLFNAPNLSRRGGAVAAYPTRGGNIRIAAAGDVRSAPSSQLVTDWLWRRGPLDGVYGADVNTSWWVMFNLFQQGVGVLGGGSLAINAGRDILNTSAVIPTTGRLLTATGDAAALRDLVLTGGGRLQIDAGGDIISGVFENDWGNSTINAGGAITSGPHSTFGQQYPDAQSVNPLPPPETQVYPIIVAGNGTFDIAARSGLELEGVANSTTLPATVANAEFAQQNATNAAFYTYAPTSRPSTLNIASVGGDVTLNPQAFLNLPIVALSDGNVYDGTASPFSYLSVYPSNVSVASLSGDVDLGDARLAKLTPYNVGLTLFPAAAGNLRLLAAASINNNGAPASVTLSEVNPARVPSPFAPSDGTNFSGLADVALPTAPLHQGDSQPVLIIADAGDIAPLLLSLPKQGSVIAGGNINELDFTAKNLSPADVTLVSAGGDISYSTPTAAVTNALIRNNTGINVAGPGQLVVLAGGTINLGDSNGLRTTGSLSDPRLPSNGASMVIGAGLGSDAGKLRPPAYAAFIAAYLDPSTTTGAPSSYASTLVDYMRQLDPVANSGLSYADALLAFKSLTPGQQLPLLARVLSDELSQAGLAHSQQGASYDRGYTAIETLFPAKDSAGRVVSRSGDLNMFFSQLKTEQGGDISLLVPGGSVVVGVPNPPASLGQVKSFVTPLGLTVPSEVNLGILVLGQGAIRGFANQNFEVNQSRILTLEGGDIILWASNGNIDAGKGAKSASGAPPPVIQTDANGNLFVDPSNAVSGSGIGQLLTSPGQTAGLVNLIAPKGAVDAGDAGIRVAGNLNIAALQVIGAANITVVGTSTGVPTSDAGALSGALSGANSLGDASKNAVDQLGQDLANAGNYQQLTDELQPVFINVKMFCLGVQCETR